MTAPEPRRQVLFVDDEQAVLDGLRNVLRGERRRWEMRFATGGEAALAMLAEQPADVVVSDMRMPGLDGVQLLRRVQEAWPRTTRIILSGQADLAAVAAASAVAHQYLLKPCDADQLRSVIAQACELQEVLRDEPLRLLVGSLGSLPAAPGVYASLTAALALPEVPVAQIARIVETDVGLTGRVLQFVNSAWFGLRQRVTGIDAAVVYLGATTMRHLALSVELFRAFGGDGDPARIEALERHAQLTARIARALVADRAQADTAFSAGLLHDCGELVLLSRLREPYGEVLRRLRASGGQVHRLEEEVLGASHAAVGAYLLGLWGLPTTIVEAVAHHHDEPRLAGPALDVTAAVGVGSLLAKQADAGADGALGDADARLLAGLAGDRAPAWSALAEEARRGLA